MNSIFGRLMRYSGGHPDLRFKAYLLTTSSSSGTAAVPDKIRLAVGAN
ncbi:hypothetical protein [Sphingobacterium puteale]